MVYLCDTPDRTYHWVFITGSLLLTLLTEFVTECHVLPPWRPNHNWELKHSSCSALQTIIVCSEDLAALGSLPLFWIEWKTENIEIPKKRLLSNCQENAIIQSETREKSQMTEHQKHRKPEKVVELKNGKLSLVTLGTRLNTNVSTVAFTID